MENPGLAYQTFRKIYTDKPNPGDPDSKERRSKQVNVTKLKGKTPRTSDEAFSCPFRRVQGGGIRIESDLMSKDITIKTSLSPIFCCAVLP